MNDPWPENIDLNYTKFNCSEMEAVLWSFYGNRTKEVINQGIFQIHGGSIRLASDRKPGELGIGFRWYLVTLLAFGLVQVSSLLIHCYKRILLGNNN